MKYILFVTALVAGVPGMAALSALSVKMKHLLFTLLIFSFMLGSRLSINLVSMEHYRGPVRGFEITLSDLITLGLVIGMLLRSGSRVVFLPRFFWPFLAFFLVAVANVALSEYTLYGWFVIWQLFRMGLLYWMIYNFFVTDEYSPESIRALMNGFILTGLLLLAITFKQKYVDGIYRAMAFFDHSNTIPSFALLYLCLLIVWGLYEQRLGLMTVLIALAAALGTTFAILATGSRTGMVTAAGAYAAAIGLANLFRSSRGRPRGVTLRTRVASVIIILGMLAGFLMVLDTVIDRFLNAPASSEEAREEFEISAVMMADDYRFGVGLNQFSQVLTEESAYREHFVAMGNEEEGGVAHHIYLLTAAEMGWPGMYLFIGLIALLVLSMVWNGIRMRTTDERLLLAAAVGVCILLLIGFYEWVLRQTPVLCEFVTLIAFGQAMVSKVKRDRKARIRAGREQKG